MPVLAPCPSCSAEVEVDDNAFSVVCPKCNSFSMVERDGGAICLKPFEDQSEPLAPEHAATSDEPARTPTADDRLITELDRNWQFESRKFYVFNLGTGHGPPELRTGIAVGAGLVGMGVWITMKTNPLLGLVCSGVGIAFFIWRQLHCTAYQEALRKYQRRRRASIKAPEDPIPGPNAPPSPSPQAPPEGA